MPSAAMTECTLQPAWREFAANLSILCHEPRGHLNNPAVSRSQHAARGDCLELTSTFHFGFKQVRWRCT
jgi:hypothetical protein